MLVAKPTQPRRWVQVAVPPCSDGELTGKVLDWGWLVNDDDEAVVRCCRRLLGIRRTVPIFAIEHGWGKLTRTLSTYYYLFQKRGIVANGVAQLFIVRMTFPTRRRSRHITDPLPQHFFG